MVHSIVQRARVLDPDMDLDVISSTIALDDGWSPFVQGDVVCAIPDGLITQALAINPHAQERYLELEITQSYAYYWIVADVSRAWAGKTCADVTVELAGKTCADLTAGWREWFDPAIQRAPDVRTMRLLIRRRVVAHKAAELRLRVASDEMALHDDAHVNYMPFTPPGTKLWQIIEYVLQRAGRTLGDMSSTAAAQNVNAQLAVWKPGETAWDYLNRQVRWAGLLLWANEYGLWRFREAHPIPALLAEVKPGVNMVDLDDVIDRDDEFYTASLITYRWADNLGAQREQVDLSYTSRYPVRVLSETFDGVQWPGAGTAAARIQNLMRRERPVEVPAVADWRYIPGQLIDITQPVGPVLQHAISRVAFEYPADTMTIRTRDRG